MTVTRDDAPRAAPANGTTRLGLGLALLVLAVLAWLWHGRADSNADRAWSRQGVPPASVEVTAGQQYHVSTAAGPRGLAIDSMQCTWAAGAAAPQSLAVTLARGDTRVNHVIGSFVAPVTGRLTIVCPQAGPVFVDDADDAPFDWAGAAAILTAFAGVAGVATTLSALYDRRRFGVR